MPKASKTARNDSGKSWTLARYMFKDTVYSIALLIVSMSLSVLLTFVAIILEYGVRLPLPFPHFLWPRNQGLNDHVQYGITVILSFGLVMFVAFLVYAAYKKGSKIAIAWILAACVELVFLFISLFDRSVGFVPYTAASFAEGWVQLAAIVPLVIGYLYIFWRGRSNNHLIAEDGKKLNL